MEKITLKALGLIFLLMSATAFSQNTEDISGQVLYHDDYPMSGVNAYLVASDGNIINSAVTDIDGVFEFENVPAGNYTVTFSTDQPAGGVELADAFLVMLKLMNQTTLNPVQTLAADVNGSGTITWADYWMILISYLNQGNQFPAPWVFESVQVTIPSESRDGFVLHGSSSGDVNGSLVPDPKSNSIFLNNPVIELSAGSSDPIAFNLAGGQNLQIVGMHLSIKVPDGLIVTGVESAISAARIFTSDNHIKVTWIDKDQRAYEMTEGSPLLVIQTKAKELSRDGESFSLKLDEESHFINLDGDLVQGVSMILPTINLNLRKESAHSVYPNPFTSYTTVEYQVPQEGQVVIALFDQTGRQVMEIENSIFAAGTHQVKIDGSSLLPGIYHYNIRYSGSEYFIKTGSMIKSK
jgi:hypothetical protein